MAHPDRHVGPEGDGARHLPDPPEESPPRTGPWTDSDIETLIEMWHMRYSNTDIAEVLERPANAVAIKASRLSLPPRRELERNKSAKIRPCLRCRSSFHSHGSGNRICDPCKSSSDWMSGGDDYFNVMTGG